jgi:hypothetical protein
MCPFSLQHQHKLNHLGRLLGYHAVHSGMLLVSSTIGYFLLKPLLVPLYSMIFPVSHASYLKTIGIVMGMYWLPVAYRMVKVWTAKPKPKVIPPEERLPDFMIVTNHKKS